MASRTLTRARAMLFRGPVVDPKAVAPPAKPEALKSLIVHVSGYTAVLEGDFIKVTHPNHGTICYARLNRETGKAFDIDFLSPSYQRANGIRQPACDALAEIEKQVFG